MMSDDAAPDIVDQLNAMNKALHVAWVLLGRCDATLEALESPRLSALGRREIIQKMRAEILHAVGSQQ